MEAKCVSFTLKEIYSFWKTFLFFLISEQIDISISILPN